MKRATLVFLTVGLMALLGCLPYVGPEPDPAPDPTSCSQCLGKGGGHFGCRHGEAGVRCECSTRCSCDH